VAYWGKSTSEYRYFACIDLFSKKAYIQKANKKQKMKDNPKASMKHVDSFRAYKGYKVESCMPYLKEPYVRNVFQLIIKWP